MLPPVRRLAGREPIFMRPSSLTGVTDCGGKGGGVWVWVWVWRGVEGEWEGKQCAFVMVWSGGGGGVCVCKMCGSVRGCHL